MTKTDFTYPSADGSTLIHAVLWEPEQPPKAILQVAHGITEHMGRYEAFARYFTDRGYAVAGGDHLGHGLSLDPAHPLPMYFGPKGSWSYVTADIKTCAELLKKRHPGLPHCLLGFSLGSFAVRCLMGDCPDLADLVILAGTGQMSGPELAIAGAIAGLEERRCGDTKDTPLLRKLTMDTYNQRFKPCRTRADWLCANGEAVDEYLADPLCGEGFTVGSFRELLRGMKTCAGKAHAAKTDPALPVLLLSGREDPVGGFGKGAKAVRAQLQRQGMRDVELQLFEGMRHDIFHEKDRAAVLEHIGGWLERHIRT